VFRLDGTKETYGGEPADSIREEAAHAAAAAAADPLAGPTAEYVRGPAGTWVVHRRGEQVALDDGEPRFTRPDG
jgi:hypothetical protein